MVVAVGLGLALLGAVGDEVGESKQAVHNEAKGDDMLLGDLMRNRTLLMCRMAR